MWHDYKIENYCSYMKAIIHVDVSLGMVGGIKFGIYW
jgi:hypothetical protein